MADDITALAIPPENRPITGQITPDLIEEILKAAQARRSPHTIEAYRRDLVALGIAVMDGGTATDVLRRLLIGGPVQASLVIDRWQALMEAEGSAPATVARKIKGVLACVSFFRNKGFINWKIKPDGLHNDKPEEREGPNQETVRALFRAAAEQKDRWIARRDVALLWLLAGCGLRASEAAALRIKDIDVEKSVIKVVRKGARRNNQKDSDGLPKRPTPERIPVSPQVLFALQNWTVCRSARHKTLSGEDHVFIRMDRNRKDDNTPIDGMSVHSIIVRIGSLIGIKLWPHALRHSAITEAVRATNGNIKAVKKFAGHRSIQTTMVYVDQYHDEEDVKNVGGLVAESIEQAPEDKKEEMLPIIDSIPT